MHKHRNEIWVYVQSWPYDLVWRKEVLEIKYTLNTGKNMQHLQTEFDKYYFPPPNKAVALTYYSYYF